MLRRLLILALLLPATAVAADTTDENLLLAVKPVLCITDTRNPSCDMLFVVEWRSSETGYYCLFNNLDESALRCWPQHREGETTDQRTVDESFSFWMTSEDLVRRIAQVDVDVLRMDSDDRRRKRRKRHVWDIN